VFAEAGGEHASAAAHLVSEADHPRAGLRNPRPNHDLVVVAGGEQEPATHLRNRQQDALGLHVAVADTPLAAELDSTHFHPDQVVRVIHHAHLVRFRIPHADLRVAVVHGADYTVRAARNMERKFF
jgi:hypothetical protein